MARHAEPRPHPNDRAEPCVADRILATASDLFYKEGIQAVGIQRLIEEAGVAKASLYAHYPSKDDLVAAYLRRKSADARAQVETAFEGRTTPEARLGALFELATDWMTSRDFRGCPFQNAAGELACETHPAKAVITEYRAWLRGLFEEIARSTGAPDAEPLGGALLALFDGAAARVLSEHRPDAIHDARWAAGRLLASARSSPRA